MEKFAEKGTPRINLRNKEIRILVPGYFKYIHAGHLQLLLDCKAAYKKVHLIVGIIDDGSSSSMLGLHEKEETFKHIPEVDEIVTLFQRPTLDYLRNNNIDYLATANAESYDFTDQVLKFDKKLSLCTSELIARVLRQHESHINRILERGVHRSALGLSLGTETLFACKRKVKEIKQGIWENGALLGNRIESAVDESRKTLQTVVGDWGEKQEKMLVSWLTKARASVSVLTTLLQTVWEER
jgi:glycerol-3-phosphate cytidylyltransferase-like family protein